MRTKKAHEGNAVTLRTWVILVAAIAAFACGAFAEEASDGVFRLNLLPGECWWGGLTIEGRRQPFSDAEDYSVDMRVMHGRGDSGSNPAAPLLVSSRGRWIWCEQSFKIE